MDFMHLVRSKQKQIGLTDKEVSMQTGISEYTYYNLVKYRVYLNRLGYFALSGVFGLPIVDDFEIENILDENKRLVGLPESNIELSVNVENQEKVEKLEKELARLQIDIDGISGKNKVINSQYKEIETLKKEIDVLKASINEQVGKAYSDGIKDASIKITNMQNAGSQQLINALTEEYTEKIDKLELSLKKMEFAYSTLYREVESKNLHGDLNGLTKPLLLMKEELGLSLNLSLVGDILNKYYDGNLSVEHIAKLFDLSEDFVKEIVVDYAIVEKNGVKSYVKRQ